MHISIYSYMSQAQVPRPPMVLSREWPQRVEYSSHAVMYAYASIRMNICTCRLLCNKNEQKDTFLAAP